VYKNLKTMNRAVKLLQEQGLQPQISLTLEEAAMAASLEEPLAEGVYTFTGRISHGEVMERYGAATLLFPSYLESLGLPLVEARGCGSYVIAADRSFAREALRGYDNCAFVGTSAIESGILQGEMIGEYLLQNYNAVDLNGDGVISYIQFKGEEGNNEAIYRTQYSVSKANEALNAAGKPSLRFYDPANANNYHVDQNGQWSAAAANEYMTTALASHSTANRNMIELVICNNDGMAEGAISALKTAGYNNGGSSVSIPVFGVDATEAAKSLIREGAMTGTVRQDAAGMADALALLAGNALDEGKALMEGTENLSIDENVRKIRIHYAKYLGE
jgi:methyl-galactoside transport system substrate-binding protein